MRTFLGPKNHDPAVPKNVQGWLATNLVMPGAGSLAAGKKVVGMLQLIMCIAGFAMSSIFGVRFIFWSLAHWSEFYGPSTSQDPLAPLRDLWVQARWPLLGIALFALAWLWAMSTSYALLKEAKRTGPPAKPEVLRP